MQGPARRPLRRAAGPGRAWAPGPQARRERRARRAGAAGPGGGGAGEGGATRTCRVCKQQFVEAENHGRACRHHPALYTGGEVSKALGFARAGALPEQQLRAVTGRQGLMRFWDCCGAEDPHAPGCAYGKHVPFGE